MTERFDGKVLVVTAGVSGIGGKITERLVREGASVVVGDLDEPLIDKVVAEHGDAVLGVRTDATDEAQFERLMAAAVERHGKIDGVFNCVGAVRRGTIQDIAFEDFDFLIRTNLYSAFLGTRLAARQFLAQGTGGAIVNIASLCSIVPMHFGVGYTVGKAGVVMLTRQAALELGNFGIRVNAVSPGLVETPMTRHLLAAPGAADIYLERIPLNRTAQPEDIAAAALFLASDDASYISGDNLLVDGGWSTTGYPDLRRQTLG